jgi:hypothetical protein
MTAVAGTFGAVLVVAVDPYGNQDYNYTGTVHLGSNDPNAYIDPDYTYTSADFGQHYFAVVLVTAGSRTLTATDGSLSGAQAGILIIPAAAAQLLVSSSPTFAAGVADTVTVTVADAYGNVVPNFTGTVQLTSTDPLATLPAAYAFTTADAGVHTFTGVVLRTTGRQTFYASDVAAGLFGMEDVMVV